MKYIDAERLKAEIEKGTPDKVVLLVYRDIILSLIDSLQQEQTDMGEVSDGYHTFNELYYYRMLYNAAFFNLLPKEWVHKSKRHHTGEECFGGGWFIVMANLPTGQISNHYELKDWDLFKIPEKEFADEWDGHTPQEAAERIYKYLQQEQPEVELEKEIIRYRREDMDRDTTVGDVARHFYGLRNHALEEAARHVYESWMGGTMDDVRRDMVELGKALNAIKEEKK
jgi:hypothetical protein